MFFVSDNHGQGDFWLRHDRTAVPGRLFGAPFVAIEREIEIQLPGGVDAQTLEGLAAKMMHIHIERQ